MRKLKYIIGRIFGMNYKNMFEALNRIHKKTGKNRVIMFFDMVFCAFRYGAGYMELRGSLFLQPELQAARNLRHPHHQQHHNPGL